MCSIEWLIQVTSNIFINIFTNVGPILIWINDFVSDGSLPNALQYWFVSNWFSIPSTYFKSFTWFQLIKAWFCRYFNFEPVKFNNTKKIGLLATGNSGKTENYTQIVIIGNCAWISEMYWEFYKNLVWDDADTRWKTYNSGQSINLYL